MVCGVSVFAMLFALGSVVHAPVPQMPTKAGSTLTCPSPHSGRSRSLTMRMSGVVRLAFICPSRCITAVYRPSLP